MGLSRKDWLSLRPGWRPLPIALVIAGFLVWWPVGVAILAYIIVASRKRSEGIEKPWGDWPRTEFLQDQAAFRISGKYAEPSDWWQHAYPIVVLIALVIFVLSTCSPMAERLGGGPMGTDAGANGALIYIGLAIAAFFVIAGLGQLARRRNLNIVMTPETIEIDGRRYARAVPHQFSIEEHEQTWAESRHNASRIYRDAMQVVMRYGDRRIPVAGFERHKIRMAEALLVRLQTVDKGIEELLVSGASASSTPGERDDFGPARPIR